MKDPNTLPRIKTADELIKKIDDNYYLGERVAFDTYKEFDYDKDGFVSQNDIKATIIKNNWMEPHEADTIVEYIDPQNKGYADFRQFSKKIRYDMTNLDENYEQKTRNIMQPSREHVKKRMSELTSMSKTFTSLKNSYRPDINASRN
jgi:hypothetical protein